MNTSHQSICTSLTHASFPQPPGHSSLPLHPSITLPIYPSTWLSLIYLPNHPSFHPLIHPSIQLSLIHPPTHLPSELPRSKQPHIVHLGDSPRRRTGLNGYPDYSLLGLAKWQTSWKSRSHIIEFTLLPVTSKQKDSSKNQDFDFHENQQLGTASPSFDTAQSG